MSDTKTEVFTITEEEEKSTAESGTVNKRRWDFEQYVQPCLAELFGTSMFVFVGVSGAMIHQVALAHGLALAVLITVFGKISGGHFNPAVSLSVYLCGGMGFVMLLPYIIAQLCGGMIGAGLTKAIYDVGVYSTGHGGAFTVNSNLVSATLAETLLTMILTMVVCMGAINGQTRSPMAPFCIGLIVTANIFAGGAVSGACMNPARALGPAVVNNHWTHHWVYWVGPVCGALITVGFVRLFFGDHKTRILCK